MARRCCPADPRFAGLPLPLVVHILGATTYALLGALQFAPRFRRRHWTWHRRAGRVLAVAGLCVAGSALWMTLAYSQKPGTGDLLFVLRLVFASAMAGCLVLGFTAVRRRDIPAHRAWMIRAYAIGLAAGTQAFTEGIGGALFGTGEVRGDLAKGAGVGHQPRHRGVGHPQVPRRRASLELTAQPLEVAQHPRAREQPVVDGEERRAGVLEPAAGGRQVEQRAGVGARVEQPGGGACRPRTTRVTTWLWKSAEPARIVSR